MEEEKHEHSLVRLIERVKTGDHSAFTRLYSVTNKKVLIACQRVLVMPSLAEDAMQETFLKVWTHAHQFDSSKSSGSAWLETIARHTALDELRRQRLVPYSDSADMTSQRDHIVTEGPAHQLQTQQRCSAVREGISRLGKYERDSLQLAFFYDFSHVQLAERMDRPLGTVKSWIRRGMHQLRQDLGAVHGQP
ncbi:MAG: sigma-70 family RNA polymerase sigma factor [Alcanivoracaceae bacterium]|nr:sigma-70 family RNA polymerase sigma factor [Alcanivoracaceae bacterium]